MADIDLTSSTENLVKGAKNIKETGMGYQEIVAAIYNLTRAVYAICNNLDEDAATLGTDYLAKIGTPLNTALRAKVDKPHGDTTAA